MFDADALSIWKNSGKLLYREALTPDAIRAALSYCHLSGKIFWKARPDTSRENRTFNKKYSGKEAGTVMETGYRCLRIRHAFIRSKVFIFSVHRVAWAHYHNAWPVHELDHINRNKLDNRIANLRDIPHSENVFNISMRSDNTSGFKGVCFYKRDKTWKAQICFGGRARHLGYFPTKEEAAAAYDTASLRFHAELGAPNFILGNANAR